MPCRFFAGAVFFSRSASFPARYSFLTLPLLPVRYSFLTLPLLLVRYPFPALSLLPVRYPFPALSLLPVRYPFSAPFLLPVQHFPRSVFPACYSPCPLTCSFWLHLLSVPAVSFSGAAVFFCSGGHWKFMGMNGVFYPSPVSCDIKRHISTSVLVFRRGICYDVSMKGRLFLGFLSTLPFILSLLWRFYP